MLSRCAIMIYLIQLLVYLNVMALFSHRNTAKQEILWRYSLQCLRKNLNDVILQNIGEKLENIKELEDDAMAKE